MTDKYSRGPRRGKVRKSHRRIYGLENMSPEQLAAQEVERRALGTTDEIERVIRADNSMVPPGGRGEEANRKRASDLPDIEPKSIRAGLRVSAVRAETGPFAGGRPWSFVVSGDAGDEEPVHVVLRFVNEARAGTAHARAVQLVERLGAPEALDEIRRL